MPEYLSPGVYVEEIELGPRPIEGVSTSTAGFLGETLRGPEEPRFISGFEQFKRLYGGFIPSDTSINNKDLPFAIQGFFENGGQRCFVARIVHATDPNPAANPATLAKTMTVTLGGMKISAIGPGDFGNRIAGKVTSGSLSTTAKPLCKLTLVYWDILPTPLVDPTDPGQVSNPNRREGTLVEVYDNLSDDPASIDFYEKIINGASSLIRADRVANGLPPLNPTLAVLATNGANATVPTVVDDYVGRELPPLPNGTIYKTGLKGFEQIDEIALLIAPAHHNVPNLRDQMINHCTKLKDRFAILHSDPASDKLANLDAIRPPDTTFAAFYFPWIKVFNPLTNQDIMVPPSGHVAGIYAKTDVERGVYKAPANEIVAGATSLQFQITKAEQDLLNPKGVNCIRVFPSRGIRVWGARTGSTNSLWKYINVRRFFLFLAESIDEGTQWVVFEGNSERLWARVRQTIVQFLMTQFREGALMGTRPEEAFFVKVDRTTMTQGDIDNGRLICIIGVAPVKPAEFVIFRLAQFQGGSEITEI
jgi:uncharacterized protein